MNRTIPVRPLATLKLITLPTLAALLLLGGCNWVGLKGSGDIKTENRKIEDFNTLEASGAFEVTWVPGPPSLSITTDDNLLKHIETNVSRGRLQIDWKKQLRSTRGIKVKVSSSRFTGAEINGAVRLNASKMSGQDFFLEANGATRVTLDGSVNGLTASMNGASRLDAESLVARRAELAINGAGRADVNASDVLKVAVSGAGRVDYLGDPKLEQEINGAGRVRRRND